MTLQTPINSKTQSIKMAVEDKKTFDTVLNIIKFHADKVVSVTMGRGTAHAIYGRYFGAVRPSLSNLFNEDVEINNQVITFNDFELADDVTIIYERRFAYFDDEIRRKIKQYTNVKNVR